jgi:hypothetical protein
MTLCDGCNKAARVISYELTLRTTSNEADKTLAKLDLCGQCAARVESEIKRCVANVLQSELRTACPGLTTDQLRMVEAYYQKRPL